MVVETSDDMRYMHRALRLAELGGVAVAPNPMVGAVIVNNSNIIGEGYHGYYGGPHAEVNAIDSVSQRELLSESTLYVTLEPCAHFGKTPPCADLIVKHGFRRVVVACLDSFSEVSGRGIDRMRRAGIHVDVGILESEAREVNKRFFTLHEKGRPYVILKWAHTKDGFLDKLPQNRGEGINWITGDLVKQLVHQLRSKEQAILVGQRTIAHDDPLLTVREVSGSQPIRVVLDPDGVLSAERKVFQEKGVTWVFVKNGNASALPLHVRQIELESYSIEAILSVLKVEGISSVFVEGGAFTIGQFIDQQMWDEAYVFEGDVFYGEGLLAPMITNAPSETLRMGKDQLKRYLSV